MSQPGASVTDALRADGAIGGRPPVRIEETPLSGADLSRSPPTPAGAIYVDDNWGSKGVNSAIMVSYGPSAPAEANIRSIFEYDDSSERIDQLMNARVFAKTLSDKLRMPVIDRSEMPLLCACNVNASRRAKRRASP